MRDDLFPNPYELNDLRWEPDGKGFTFVYNQRGHQALQRSSRPKLPHVRRRKMQRGGQVG